MITGTASSEYSSVAGVLKIRRGRAVHWTSSPVLFCSASAASSAVLKSVLLIGCILSLLLAARSKWILNRPVSLSSRMVAVPTPGAVSVRPIADRLVEITRAASRTREKFPPALRVSSSPIAEASASTSGVTVSVSVSLATRSIWSRVALSIRDDARLKPPFCICSMVCRSSLIETLILR